MKKQLLVALIIATVLLSGCTASWGRYVKDIKSDWAGGLDRVVYVYDYGGNLLKVYQGNIDIEISDSKVKFDMYDKRVIIYNAIVIVEEL